MRHRRVIVSARMSTLTACIPVRRPVREDTKTTVTADDRSAAMRRGLEGTLPPKFQRVFDERGLGRTLAYA